MAQEIALLLLVYAGEANDPAIVSTATTARDMLPTSSVVVVREIPRDTTDADIVNMEAAASATSSAEILWRDDSHTTVRVRVHVAQRWLERDVGFSPKDAPSERGRTLGFAVASMLPELKTPRAAPSSPAPSTEAVPRESAAEARVAAPEVSRPFIGAFDAAAAGAFGIAGYGGGVGPALGMEWNLSSVLALRAGLDVGFGSVPPAQASLIIGDGSVGVAARSRVFRSVEVGGRVSVGASWVSLSHFSGDDPEAVRQSRWLLSGRALGEVGIFVSNATSIEFALGCHAMAGRTDVYLHGDKVAVIPNARGVGEIGVRARF